MIDAPAVAALLDEMYRLDPDATAALLEARVPCNRAIAEHPTIQVSAGRVTWSVGLLGVLNGLLACAGERLVCSEHDDATGRLTGFGLLGPPPDR